MRYYDISGRVAVFNLAHAVDCSGTSPATTIIDPITGTNALFVSRLGYYSYVLQVVVSSNMDDVADTVAVTAKLQSSDSAAFASPVDVTSASSTAAKYKQLYFNSTGSTTNHNLISAGFQDQPYTFTADADIHTHPVVLDARIFGSLRDEHAKRYVGPYVTVTLTQTVDSGGSEDANCRADVNLILGGGSEMPVFNAGTAGTNTYYSTGQ